MSNETSFTLGEDQFLDAQEAGAFPEDAIGELDAIESVNDPVHTPADAFKPLSGGEA